MLPLLLKGVIEHNRFDEICNFCIELMEDMSSALGMTYGELNVWLFIIIQPALILLFFTTTVILTIRLYRKNRDFKRGNLITATVSTFIILAFAVVLLISVWMFWIFIIFIGE